MEGALSESSLHTLPGESFPFLSLVHYILWETKVVRAAGQRAASRWKGEPGVTLQVLRWQELLFQG